VDRDVCISGPDAMIIKTAEALRESGRARTASATTCPTRSDDIRHLNEARR
jgi:hypothetical protein